jgi:isopentenyldiphosphate isomerase
MPSSAFLMNRAVHLLNIAIVMVLLLLLLLQRITTLRKKPWPWLWLCQPCLHPGAADGRL